MTTATTVKSSCNATRSFVNAKLPDLDYDFSALEPVICAEIMEIHHQKHHNTYVTNFNVAQEKYAEAEAKGPAKRGCVSGRLVGPTPSGSDTFPLAVRFRPYA